MCALLLTHPRAHTPGAVDTHTHTWSSGHTHTSPGAADTHTTLMFNIIIHLVQKDFICILMKYEFLMFMIIIHVFQKDFICILII